jgi:hypothetical protein
MELRIMEITISQMAFNEIDPIIPLVRKGNMRVRNTNQTVWFGAKVGEELVGIVSCVIYETYVFYNTDFVKKEYRKKGIYSRLFVERDKFVSGLDRNLIKAKCTPFSVNHYLKNGFVATGNRKSITFVERRI